jgi:hypothetical protein
VTSEGRLETHVRGKAVCALVVHNGELYVRLDLKDIQIYDAETLEYKRDLKVPELITVADMASCSYHNCIYIAESTSKRVHRVESEKSIEKWSVNDVPVGLSISSTHSVLVICCHPGMIKEFSTNGHLLSEIAILSDVNRPLHMSHAAELGAKRYVVCYGVEDGIVNTVCIVNCRGEIHHPCYGGDLVRPNAASPAAGFKRVAAANGFILVADCTRQRVVMLSPSLTFVRDDISSLKELDMMWYDRAARRLYVAGNSNEPGGSVVNVYQMHH